MTKIEDQLKKMKENILKFDTKKSVKMWNQSNGHHLKNQTSELFFQLIINKNDISAQAITTEVESTIADNYYQDTQLHFILCGKWLLS